MLRICGTTNPIFIIEMRCETGAAGIRIEEKADMKAAAGIANAKGAKVFGNVATDHALLRQPQGGVTPRPGPTWTTASTFLPGLWHGSVLAFGEFATVGKARDD